MLKNLSALKDIILDHSITIYRQKINVLIDICLGILAYNFHKLLNIFSFAFDFSLLLDNTDKIIKTSTTIIFFIIAFIRLKRLIKNKKDGIN